MTKIKTFKVKYELTIDIAPNVWLHSLVGRASHQYAEVTDSNPVEALNFFQVSLFQLLKLEIHCDDHLSLSYLSAVHV